MTHADGALLLPRRHGVSYLVAMMIAVVATGGISYAIFGDLEGTIGTMTGADRITILDLNAYKRGDSLVITGNIKNTGTSSLDSITIDEISVGDLVVTQTVVVDDGRIADGTGDVTVSGLDGSAARSRVESVVANHDTPALTGTPSGACSSAAHPASGFHLMASGGSGTVCMAAVTLTGLSIDEDSLAHLPAGGQARFRIVVTGVSDGGAGVLDVAESVPTNKKLFASFSATDGRTTTISDPVTTRVVRR